MKTIAISFIGFAILISGCKTRETDYELIATYQDHAVTEPDLEVTDSTRVLVVVPHADDETIAGGLIALLNDRGASTHLLMLCGHDEIRSKELECSASKLGIEQVDIAGFINNSWENIMSDNIDFWYDQRDSIKEVIAGKINSYRPHYLITYDAEIGGYGHPEHRISSELTEEIFRENIASADFSVKKIFQITLSEQLEKFLVSKSPGYDLAKQRTGSQGLPKPDVAIDITNYWDAKNQAARCHQSQLHILKRFHIIYDEGDKDAHNKAFSKEYYRVVERT